MLELNGSKNSQHTLSSMELWKQAKQEFPEELNIAKNTFLQYVSNTVKDVETRINCLGRKQGYYLVELSEEIEKAGGLEVPELGAPEKAVSPRKQKEKLLYPVLESWLITQDYQTSDISTGKTLGKWGNPDIAGIHALDGLSGTSIEVVTIEAKVSLENWEQWIFEAISHRRFANRSYFAFAHPSEMIAKIPQDMRYYAELYQIGVLVLSIENSNFEKLNEGQFHGELDLEDVDIIELYSAPYNFVQPKYQVKFLKAQGIECSKSLYRWGSNS